MCWVPLWRPLLTGILRSIWLARLVSLHSLPWTVVQLGGLCQRSATQSRQYCPVGMLLEDVALWWTGVDDGHGDELFCPVESPLLVYSISCSCFLFTAGLHQNAPNGIPSLDGKASGDRRNWDRCSRGLGNSFLGTTLENPLEVLGQSNRLAGRMDSHTIFLWWRRWNLWRRKCRSLECKPLAFPASNIGE